MRHFKIYRDLKTITFLKKDRCSEPVGENESTSYSSVPYSPYLILLFPLPYMKFKEILFMIDYHLP